MNNSREKKTWKNKARHLRAKIRQLFDLFCFDSSIDSKNGDQDRPLFHFQSLIRQS